MKHIMRRRGFTLIELLVVIGIILVLIAIVVMGVRHTSALAMRHETAAEMKLCEDLLKEYQSINGLKNIEGPVGSASAYLKLPYPPWLNHEYQLPIYLDAATEVTGQMQSTALGFAEFTGTPPVNTTGQPRPVDAGDMSDASSGNNPRWGCRAVYNTQGIMFMMIRDPKNKAAISALPPQRLLETWAPFSQNDKPQPPFTIEAAVVLDGWGDPIIYVPRGGMHVWMDPVGGVNFDEYIVRTTGTYKKGTEPPVSANDHPFFASAGADRYFTDLLKRKDGSGNKASDNIYSFQEQ